jgi:hypothetical protein
VVETKKSINKFMQLVGWSVSLGVILGMTIFVVQPHIIAYVYAELTVEAVNEIIEPEPKEVRIQVVYNWDKAKIEEEIRKACPETPNTAVAIAKCESRGLTIEIQAEAILWYGREESFGLFQIHAPDHEENTVALGFGDYRTNPEHNIGYARWLYDRYGWQPWACYTKGIYWNYL